MQNMEKFSMCRICLAIDVARQQVANTHLQEMYQSLTFLPLETDDKRPTEVCYICWSKLEDCYQLRKRCLKSEKMFSEMLRGDVSAPTESGPNATADPPQETTHCDVKTEPPEEFDDFEPKIEIEIGEDALTLEEPTLETQLPSEATTSRNLAESELTDTTVEELQANGKKKFQCKECEKCFVHKRTLVAHSRVHSGEEPHQCNECKKCFSTKSNLNVHSLTHAGVKPFQCNECMKCFNKKSSLDDHSRLHTGEKPYQCKECNKCFNRKYSLDIHNRRHTGVKPFQCKICKKCFSTKSNFYIHIRKHTEGQVS